MALKDWTKTGEDEWHKFVKGHSGKFYDGIFFVKTVNGDWSIDSFYRHFKPEYKRGMFKTRSQVLKFAMDYMRKN